MQELTHFNQKGEAVMVDIHEKASTHRTAIAEGTITVNEAAFSAIREGTAKKGDVLGTARIAGIMGAKQTSGLIPLCHNITLSKCTLDFTLEESTRSVRAVCTASCTGQTGVEMEALTGASIALLTIYDMCKALDRGMTISSICLREKDGGRSGHYIREEKTSCLQQES
jgi:cyclic pyranopterin phosphate synthase